MNQIKKVYVVHKTHLDIGFTDFSQKVLDSYMNHFIPQAIETAYEVNSANKPKQFVWTVGAYLIKYYLEHTDEAGKKKIEKAIRDGYVDWHLLPLTAHTELMDSDLFCYGLSIGKKLDQLYGKKHFTAKMTDVPGHTHAMVPYLKKAGVEYIHIGINAASKPVHVPPLCILKYGESEIILNYALDYGEACSFKEAALEFAHTADNVGPPDASAIKKEMERLRLKYPDAEIISGGLEGFAAEILPFKAELPVITQELGDTWIHGVAADPLKIAAFCEMKKIRRQWLDKEPQAFYSKEYDVFMENLLLLCEHTWGLDFKQHLCDYKNWNKTDFMKVREQGGSISESAYFKMELSWKEQREYLDRAIQVLPNDIKSELSSKLSGLFPLKQNSMIGKLQKRNFIIGGWKVEAKEDGSLIVREKNGQQFKNTEIGILSYETYDSAKVYECYRDYNRNLETEGYWAEPDFAKPGLSQEKTAKNNSVGFRVRNAEVKGNKLIITLSGEKEACEIYGCPRKVTIEYTLQEKGIQLRLCWFEKDANRMPEAMYLGFRFDSYEELTVWKLGLPVNPLDVIDGGNKKMHAVEKISGKNFELIPQHSPLLSIGGKNIYHADDRYGNLADGLHFILYNNRWNTNFPLWYEQNAAFEYHISIY